MTLEDIVCPRCGKDRPLGLTSEAHEPPWKSPVYGTWEPVIAFCAVDHWVEVDAVRRGKNDVQCYTAVVWEVGNQLPRGN